MIHNKLTYRLLTKSDKDEYIRLVKSFDKIFGTDPKFFLTFLDEFIAFFDDETLYAAGGAFEDNKLVATIAGYFPDSPIWYSFNQFSKLPSTGLLSSIDFLITGMKVHNLLISEAETAGWYNFYIRRRLKAQRAFEHTVERLLSKNYGIDHRYVMYHDGLYPAGKNIVFPHHNFYRPHIDAESLIVLCSLKQSERCKILSAKHPDYSEIFKP